MASAMTYERNPIHERVRAAPPTMKQPTMGPAELGRQSFFPWEPRTTPRDAPWLAGTRQAVPSGRDREE